MLAEVLGIILDDNNVLLSYHAASARRGQAREALLLPTAPRQAGDSRPPRPDDVPKKPVGRPRGAPATMVHVRLPLARLARLDRSLDRLEVRRGAR